jgi:hypothetical protein
MDDGVTISVVLWCLLIGAVAIVSEILIVRWSNSRVKLKASELLSSIGFNHGNQHYDYLKNESGYILTLNHIPKERLLERHSLRIGVNFKIPWDYDDLRDSLRKLRKEYGDYQWSAGQIYYDVNYLFLNANTIGRIHFRMDETISILKENGLNPISFKGAEEQYYAVDAWLQFNKI